MAFTRKMLKSLGVPEDAIDTIMEAHTEVTNALMKERDDARAAQPDIASLTAERDKYKKQAETARADGMAEVQAKLDAYMKEVETEKQNAGKAEAVKALLKKSGVGREDFLSLLMDKVDLSKVELDNGSVKDASFVDGLKETYAGCFGSVENRGAGNANPPTGGSQQMTKEAFFKLPLREQMVYANEHPGDWAAFTK